MRIKHTLWRVGNGYLLVPEESTTVINSNDAPRCLIFRNLKEFSEWKPKRERRKRTKPTAAEPQHTKD